MADNFDIVEILKSFLDKNPVKSSAFCEKLNQLPLSEKFLYAYTHLKSEGFLSKIERSSQKSTSKALEYKNLGNDHFARGELIEALKLYTKCAAVALPDSEELAVAYANRSAALYRLERYEACLVDVNRALQENYPEASKPKLRDRKENCWSKLCERNSFMLKYLKSVEHETLDDDTLRTDLKYAMKQFEFDVDATDMNYDDKFYLPKVNFKNKTIPVASEKIKISFNRQFGRHIVATQDIKTGEVIAIEKPYASALPLHRQYSHCANCYVRCESMIPCQTCSMVMFCSKRCRETAFNRFHRIECQVLSLRPNLFDDKYLDGVLRLLMIATKQGEELVAMMKHPIYKNPFEKAIGDVSEKFDPTDYANIHNLEDNIDKRDDNDISLHVQVVVVLIHVLRHTTFFNEPNDQDARNLTDKEKYTIRLLLKFFSVCRCNSFEIIEYGEATERINPFANIASRGNTIGAGTYSFHSLYNHSCKYNVLRNLHKDTIVTRTIEPIKAGEQLFLNYGCQYEYMPRSQRQQNLREDYCFECRCVACENNWPVSENFPSAKLEIMNCEKLTRYAVKMRELFSTPKNHQDGKVYDFLCEYLTLLCEKTKRPNREHQECYDNLNKICNARGNVYEFDRDKILLLL